MITGRVVRFDGARGYGFIAPDTGGEDVFLHVNDVLLPESQLCSGLEVEFEVEDGDRGLKASSVRLAPRAAVSTASAADGTCEVFSKMEFTRDVTELLLTAGPQLSAQQLVSIRRELLKFAESHGWIED
ncbi:cold-shock protein [Streptomyces corynorhini]|uniref:Cold shock domain-containing protein n=1 Tax=Streptomyces corynorhini TaxID=2282652 RepID=A0A370BGN7_9ACTN|nr:cold shock domain-containing protein [Streptomyces corynorhini]RDG39822.1 cold shock domain-containing protein [Streptomyces corynorhini]